MADFNESSIEALLEITKEEYNRGLEQSASIDTKVTISLPIISALFLAIADKNNCYSAIFDMTTSPSPLPIDQLIIPCIIFILYTLALLLSAYATIYSVRAILPRIFKALSPQHFYYEPLLKEEPYYIYIAIINSLFLAIEANTKANRIKMELYANGWLWAAISAFSYVMYDIIYNISMKGV